MTVVCLKKVDLIHFLSKITKKYSLIAPIKTDLVRFQEIDDAKDIILDEIPFFPVKNFIFKQKDALINFDGTKVSVPIYNPKRKVIFGIRRCDLNAIKHQDLVYMGKFVDPNYKAERDSMLLIGYHCDKACNEYAFCGSMNLTDFYDLMFIDKGDEFIVDVGSSKGQKFIDEFKHFFASSKYQLTHDDKVVEGTNRLHKMDISKLYDNPDWQKGVDQCLSCSACTSLCPTCYCFEIRDIVDTTDTKKVRRERNWSSCQQKSFTRVAGGHIFREKRSERFRHRIYHQLAYFKKKYGTNLCVGCGRCISACPTRIDFVKIINEMK